MKEKALLPVFTDEIRHMVNMRFDDIECDYDKKYGLEELNGVNPLELRAAKKNQKRLKIKEDSLDAWDELEASAPIKSAKENFDLKIVHNKFKELIAQAKENAFFNEAQCNPQWYGCEGDNLRYLNWNICPVGRHPLNVRTGSN